MYVATQLTPVAGIPCFQSRKHLWTWRTGVSMLELSPCTAAYAGKHAKASTPVNSNLHCLADRRCLPAFAPPMQQTQGLGMRCLAPGPCVQQQQQLHASQGRIHTCGEPRVVAVVGSCGVSAQAALAVGTCHPGAKHVSRWPADLSVPQLWRSPWVLVVAAANFPHTYLCWDQSCCWQAGEQ